VQEAHVKATERKELETNYLADQLGRLVQGQNPHVSVWLAILAVGALVALAYWAVPRQAAERMTVAWRELWESEDTSLPFSLEPEWPHGSVANVEKLTERHRGTPIESPARFLLAQAEQALAVRDINDAGKALAHLHRAEQLYREVLASSGQNAELRVRTHLGLAQVTEIRYWIEKARSGQDETQRLWSQTQELYNKALQIARRELPSSTQEVHPLVQEIEKHLERLRDPNTAELVFLTSTPASASNSSPSASPQPSSSPTAKPQ
jgi:hypothetical protein